MTDPLTDTILTKGRERSAPGMSHADTHTPLHGPTGGVPSDKALSDTHTHSYTRVSDINPPIPFPATISDTCALREPNLRPPPCPPTSPSISGWLPTHTTHIPTHNPVARCCYYLFRCAGPPLLAPRPAGTPPPRVLAGRRVACRPTCTCRATRTAPPTCPPRAAARGLDPPATR
eukprot:scaffold9618_cov123-Isochrysis_galbana.AAC.3